MPHAHNLRLLLQLLVRLCQLASAGRLPLPLVLGAGGQGQALARLLLALQLDEAACLVAKGALQEAFGGLLEAAADVDWSRLAPALLEALAGELGPSARCGGRHTGARCAVGLQLHVTMPWRQASSVAHPAAAGRSSVLLLSQLPLSPRGVVLRQQGALLLLSKLLPGKQAGQVRGWRRACSSSSSSTPCSTAA